MRRTFTAALVFAALLAFVTPAGAQRAGGAKASPPPPPKPILVEQPLDRGRVVGSTYTNDYFGISFNIPAGWTVHDTGVGEKIDENAKQIFRNEQDAQLKQQLEAAVDRTVRLVSASKFPPGSPQPFNATFVCAAERVPTALVKTPADYYRLTLHSLRLTKELQIEVLEPLRTKVIGANTFGLYTIRMAFNLGVTVQKHFIMVKGPYVFAIVFVLADEGDAKTFEQIIGSVRVAGRRRD